MELTPKNHATAGRVVAQRKPEDPRVLSIGQERLWYLSQLSPSAYNMPYASRIHGPLDLGLLERVLNSIIGRHEVLRTVILSVRGKPMPVLLKKWDLQVKHVDLRRLSSEIKEQECGRVLVEEAARPFNFSRDLMLRATVIQLEDDDFEFLHTAPHLAFEGGSVRVLFRELSLLYGAALRGREPKLPKLPVQFADFALWQRRLLQGDRLESLMHYWRERLKNPPIVDLPADHLRPAVYTARGVRHFFLFPPQLLTTALEFFRSSAGSTPYRGLCAAFLAFLHAYSELTDITLGSPFAPRCTGIEDLIGFFVNTVVLRTEVSGKSNFLELVKRVDTEVSSVIEQSDLTFEKIVEASQIRRDASRMPLSQMNFRAPKQPYPILEINGLSADRARYIDNKTSKFDLGLEIDPTVGKACFFEYYSDLFAESTIRMMVSDFLGMLESLIEKPDVPIASLDIVHSIRQRVLHGRARDFGLTFQA